MSSERRRAPRVFLICNAHLDPTWQWAWEEGLTETLATFETADVLLGEYPEFIFNHNEALLYEQIKQHRPDLFERIKKWVAAGRWIISGGWYLQPDCNFPSGESFVRHGLLGRRFFKREFNAEPKVAYNLDPFGHHANMPQILRGLGFRMYVHFRPHRGQLALPDKPYRWQGIDGSEVVAVRPPRLVHHGHNRFASQQDSRGGGVGAFNGPGRGPLLGSWRPRRRGRTR
jgi:alpha-mannosidase